MSYLPAPFKKFIDRYPKISRIYEELALACHEAGPLDEKTRRLVKLGIAIGHQSEGATKSHARRALEGGATAEEVRHTVLLALTTAGFPAMTAAALWVEQLLSSRGGSSND
jgi:alkylhydroperoxidase/carboxymuconolactone decarboxylase family protein YurZ